MKIRFSIPAVLMAIVFYLFGCGGDEAAGPMTPVQPDTATITINQVLLKAVPASVVDERFTGFNSNGARIFGPDTRAKATRIVLVVPIQMTNLLIEYLDANGNVLFTYSQAVSLVPGQNLVIDDPDFNAPAGPPTQVKFIAQPAAVAVGAPIAPAVQVAIQDADGTTDATSTAAVTLALGSNPGNAVLGGTLTRQAVAGIATFDDLTLSAAGSGYTLVATSEGLTQDTSTSFDVGGGIAATGLKFTVQPKSVRTGSVITPAVTVSVVDQNGNVLTSATNPITLALGTNPSGANLGGTLTQNAVNGVAAFNDLTLDKAGKGYTLVASSGSLTQAVSTAFDDIVVLAFANPVQLAVNGGANAQIFTSGRYHNPNFDDFACVQTGTADVAVYTSNGDGTFTFKNFFNLHGTAPKSILSRDIDGDGNVDLLVGCSTEVNIMKGDGTGAFSNVGNGFPTGNNNSSLAGIAVGSFVLPNRIDVAVVDAFDGSVYVFPNTSTAGNPNLGNPVKFNAVTAATTFAKQLVAGDFNGDGFADLAIGCFTQPALTVWLNSGSGNINTVFPAANSSTKDLNQVTSVAQSVAAGDLNGDGRDDLMLGDDFPHAGSPPNDADVFLAQLAGAFTGPTVFGVGGDPFSTLFTDFDQDGFLDAGIASFTGINPPNSFSDLEVLLGNGDGTFQPVKFFPTGDNSGRAVTSGDYNGDGLPDAIVGSNPAWAFINTSK